MAHYERLVFGLSWRTAISDDRKELFDYAKELNSNAYVETSFDVKHKYGFINLKKIDKAQSAAVVVGKVIEGGTGIFVHQINREEHCFIAVRETLPIENCDVVGSRVEVIAAAKALIEASIKRDGIPLKIYGDADEITGCVPLLLSKLVDAAHASEETGQVKKVKSINLKATIFIGVAIMLAGSWFAPDVISMFIEEPPPVVEPKVAHHRIVASAITSIVEQKQFPINVMPGYLNFVNNFPTRVQGWKLNTLTCQKTECVATWKREVPTATNKDFLEALAIESNDLTIAFPSVDLISRKIKFNKDETPGKLLLGTQLKFGETVLSWLQTLKDRPRIDPLTPLVPVPGSFKPDPQDMPLVGGYSFTVPYAELNKVASLPNVITIEQITLTYRDAQNINFEFQGKYYAL